jgi:hypothetical protein
MVTQIEWTRETTAAAPAGVPNGAAVAAFLAAGIGSFAMGMIAFLNGIDVLPVPTLYDPAGGVSGRTTLALIVWLISWAVLHFRWREREIAPRRISGIIGVLIALGVLGTFPPLWNVF